MMKSRLRVVLMRAAIWSVLLIGPVSFLGWRMARDLRQRPLDIALAHAVQNNDVAAARTALAHGANASLDVDQLKPVPRWQRLLELLHFRKASTALQGEPNTLLMQMLYQHPDNLALLGALLDHGANVNAKYDHDRTLLMRAAWYKHPGLVQLLLNHGADTAARDNDGWTPLMYANDAQSARLLLASGCSVRAQSADGWTPLSAEKKRGNQSVVSLLTDAGAKMPSKTQKRSRILRLEDHNGSRVALQH